VCLPAGHQAFEFGKGVTRNKICARWHFMPGHRHQDFFRH
jgi:hypothetical protein